MLAPMEAFGWYLDMHELYNEYVNSKFGQPIDYINSKLIDYSAFLAVFWQTHKIPSNLKLTRQYRDYLEHVLDYLISFFGRTEPLQDLRRIFSKVETEFEELWADGKILGWETKENGNISSQDSVLDLDYYSTVEELIEVGLEKLKEALAARGLKSGGTVQQCADRLFLTKYTPLDQLDKKHFAKGARAPEQNVGAPGQQKLNSMKEISLMEAKLQRMCELLNETISQTKDNVEKKQALTYDEMEAEREESFANMVGHFKREEVQADTESDDEDQQIYNPLKLPMGWDGKPIPYWLYKLHGLGQEAKDLWEKIQERQGLHKWHPDLEEEYEDKEGNIYNKKTYTDLQRQGLI